MKTNLIISAVLSLAIVGTTVAQEDILSTLQANYDKVSRLSIKKDQKNLEKIVRRNASSGFQYIDQWKNSLDIGATIRQNTEQLSRVHKFNSNSNVVMGISPRGRDVVCTVRSKYDVFLDSTGKQRVKGESICQDTWTKTLTGWKIKCSKIVKESSTQNGKHLH